MLFFLIFLEFLDVQLHLADKLLGHAHILIRQLVLAFPPDNSDQCLALSFNICDFLDTFFILEGDSFLEHLDRLAEVVNELFAFLLGVCDFRQVVVVVN